MNWTGFGVTFLALSAIVAARYFAVAGLAHWLVARDRARAEPKSVKLNAQDPRPGAIGREIRWSIVSSFIYAAPAAFVIEQWKLGRTALYTDVSSFGWAYIPASLLLYLFLHDTYFYWTHRAMHHRALFPVMHNIHHQSRPPTVWAAFSFNPLESLVGAVFLPALVFVIPLHVGAALALLTIMTVTSVTNHAGYEIFPRSWMRGPFGRHLITATHHDLHHRKFSCNYALYFRFWDKLMGTDRMDPGPAAGDGGSAA
ncbi:MAG: sterol desaturase family protein [Parvularculaceae bacterium]